MSAMTRGIPAFCSGAIPVPLVLQGDSPSAVMSLWVSPPAACPSVLTTLATMSPLIKVGCHIACDLPFFSPCS